jgi:hypothetical protein
MAVDVREELEIANAQLAAAEAALDVVAKSGSKIAAQVFLNWLRGARIERAANIREAIDSNEYACSSCNGALTCRGCCWGA